MNTPHKGFCGNEEPHEPHEVMDGWQGPVGYVHGWYHCEGVDEEGRAITEERTPINDCAE